MNRTNKKWFEDLSEEIKNSVEKGLMESEQGFGIPHYEMKEVLENLQTTKRPSIIDLMNSLEKPDIDENADLKDLYYEAHRKKWQMH